MVFWRIKSYFIFGLTCFVTVASMKLSISPNINETTLNVYKALEKIVSKCYHDKVNPLIMYNLMDQQLRDYSSLEHPMSLILVNERFGVNDTQAQWTNYYPTIATFVLIVDDWDQLQITLNNIYFSVWNVIEANFILVGVDPCLFTGARTLDYLWRRKFISGIFICYNNEEDVLQLYTFNPFTIRAPDPWKAVAKDKSWILFQRIYQEGEEMCLNLLFDKTTNFDGYEIRVFGVPKPGTNWTAGEDYGLSSVFEFLPYFNAEYVFNIFLKTNITPIINYNVFMDLRKHPQIALSFSDLGTNRKGVWKSYPFWQTEFVLVSQKRPFLSVGEKIQSFYSLLVILLVIISFITLFIALMLSKRQPWLEVVMELMRLLVSTGIEQSLGKLPLRIYLFGILWLVIVINATFQGKLIEFLTKPERRNAEKIDDLRDFEYNVYTTWLISKFLNHTLAKKQLYPTIVGEDVAYDIIRNDSRAAYITSDFLAYEHAFEYQFHVSHPVSRSYLSFLVSLPIIERIDQISSRYAESGLQGYWLKRSIDQYKTNLTNTEEMETSPQVRPLTVVDILFMIKFLAIGLGVSFVVFLIEIIVGRQSKKNINKHKTPPSVKKSEQTSIEVDVVSL